MRETEKIYYIERKSGEKKEEKIYYEKALRFFYSSRTGKLLGSFLAKFPFFSHFFGWWHRQKWTQKNIAPFMATHGVNASECEKNPLTYPSFDAFFIRKLKKESRPLAPGPIIPADGRYLFYQNVEASDGFIVKGKKFSLPRLIGLQSIDETYVQGSMAIARLAPSDYHRFHFPVDCVPGTSRLINGPLYSVNPIAVKQNICLLTENKRVVTLLKSDQYGTILFIEIGATSVGSIHQTYSPYTPYQKGDEKGYFSFGGSSIILLFEKDKIHFADDLLLNSSQHIETLCLMGQSLQ